jgi:dGTPase
VLYSSAFRRLAGKTQVVAASELGDYHNRMTHSLKVGQLGRRLAERLNTRHPKAGAPHPELLEAACLAHDLGHPPFGHAGEQALQTAADELILERESTGEPEETRDGEIKRKFGGFEGNAQTLRILIRLAARHPVASQGLDLTRAVLDATIKYPWLRENGDNELSKWNVYPDDLEYVTWIRSRNGLGLDKHKCVEAKLMDWCDDVAYACHDLQDFYRAGIIPMDRIFVFDPKKPRSRKDPPPLEPTLLVAESLFERFQEEGKEYELEEILDGMRKLSTVITVVQPFDGGRETKSALHQSMSQLITSFMNAVKVKNGIAARFKGDITIDPLAKLQVDILKQLIWIYVIRKPALQSQQLGQQQIVKDLLRIFYEHEKDCHLLLPPDRLEDLDRGVDYLRCCIDHVASMPESAAIALHQRFTGSHIGLHSDSSWRV